MLPITEILKYETIKSIKKEIANHKKLSTAINSLLGKNQIKLLTKKEIDKLKDIQEIMQKLIKKNSSYLIQLSKKDSSNERKIKANINKIKKELGKLELQEKIEYILSSGVGLHVSSAMEFSYAYDAFFLKLAKQMLDEDLTAIEVIASLESKIKMLQENIEEKQRVEQNLSRIKNFIA